jgi:protein-tyrosine phosphatase
MATELLNCDAPDARAQSIKRAAQLLKAGRIVALPTETVYGLAVVAGNPDAETLLRETRGRADDKPFTVALSSPVVASRFVEVVPPMARRLMSRCWPGPLTIVFENPDGRTVGLRQPDCDLALRAIERAGGAVLLPSANRPGEPPARSAKEVLDVFDGKIDAVLDGGTVPTRLREDASPGQVGLASTVVRLTPKGYEVLRKGALSEGLLRRAANLVVLFICSGNSCRSPIAEALCRKLLAERLDVPAVALDEHGYTVMSAGSAGGFAAPASAKAVEVMRQIGVDITDHLSQTVTPEMLRRADRVFVMTPEQMEQALRLAPDAKGRVALLDPKGRPVADPHGGDLEIYRRCAYVIQRALEKRIKEL